MEEPTSETAAPTTTDEIADVHGHEDVDTVFNLLVERIDGRDKIAIMNAGSLVGLNGDDAMEFVSKASWHDTTPSEVEMITTEQLREFTRTLAMLSREEQNLPVIEGYDYTAE